jgi:hypothetical protein
VRNFYSWYLGIQRDSKDAMHDDPPTLAKYVAAPLLREIEKSARGPDADYFIQAQDYMEA